MKRFQKNGSFSKSYPLEVSFYLLYLGWTVIIAGIVAWSYNRLNLETKMLAESESRKSFEKDLMFRAWATMHGGVYVPITDSTQPNPYLNVPHRDITTPSNKKLTLMNPAYMTRQVNEESFKRFGIISHITSLNPIRKENAPDYWEKKALTAFEKGEKEYLGIDTIGKKKYYRYMAPLITEQGCLKCHKFQGYKLGDIRGGISTSVLWDKYQTSFNSLITNVIIGYFVLWLLGIIGLSIVRMRFVIYITKRKEAEDLQSKLLADLNESHKTIESNIFEKNVLIEELFDANSKLEQLNSEKDKFFSIIAHDLKSPFSGFIGLSKMMAENLHEFTMSELQNNSTKMQESALTLYKLLENLLEWSRMQRGKIEFNPETCILSFLVTQNISILKEVASHKEIEIISTISEDTIALADVPMLNTVFRNLLTNAIKFTPRGGKIEIGANNKKNENDLTDLCVYVKDNGIGMSADILNSLFRIDRKVSRPGTENESSTGLGLILCKEFVEKHGGRIWVESEQGLGSTFFFTLPLCNVLL